MYMEAPQRYKGISDEPPFDRNESFYLHGSTGTGKTYYAWGITNNYNAEDFEKRGKPYDLPIRHVGCRVINVPELVMEYRILPFEDKRAFIQEWSRGHVIFDDLGAEKQTEFIQEFIYSILNTRWERQLWTGFTSNLSIGNLPYGDRIKSRIAGMVEKNIHKLETKDRRLK